MKQKNFLLLGIAILAMALLTFNQQSTSPVKGNELLLPELREHLNDLQKVEINTASESITFIRLDKEWVVSEKHNYGADFSKLSELLDGLSKTKLLEKKTIRPENFAELEVQDLVREDSKASLVSGVSPRYSFGVIVGKSAQGRDGQYVRMPDDNQVWLTDQVLNPAQSALSWLDKAIINIDSERVIKVQRFDSSGLTQVLVERVEDEENMMVQNLPEDRRLRYPSAPNELARALVNVRFSDVVPHLEEKWLGSSRSEYSLADGGMIVVKTLDSDDRKWLHLTTSGLTQVRSPGHFDKWDFEVATYVYTGLTKTLEDLMEPVIDKEPSAVPHKEPSAVLHKEPSAVLHKEPSAGFDNEP